MSKSQRAETSFVLVIFDGVLCEVHTYTVVQHESGIRKAISWSMTVYNKNSFSQYNLTAQIEPVQDKHLYTCIQVSGIPCEDYFRHMWVISVILLLACDRSLTSSSEKLTNVDINSRT